MHRGSVSLVVAVALATLFALAGTAHASQLIARDATAVRLAVDADGRALVTYRADGRVRRVLASGAVNAVAPAPGRRQVAFRLDYSGGWGAFRRQVRRGLRDACRPYDGPPLQWLVTACKARDGSYWAVQTWQRGLPNYGLSATAERAVWELRLSHWTGPLAVLDVKLNWAYGRFHHLFGRFTYRGQAVHGFRATRTGVPLDAFGRNLYVDTYNSAYGAGWRRENSFLTHRGSGAFCYGFFPRGDRPAGIGERYRATIIGPGVTPDAYWESPAPGPYSQELDLVANDEIRALGSACRPN